MEYLDPVGLFLLGFFFACWLLWVRAKRPRPGVRIVLESTRTGTLVDMDCRQLAAFIERQPNKRCDLWRGHVYRLSARSTKAEA